VLRIEIAGERGIFTVCPSISNTALCTLVFLISYSPMFTTITIDTEL